MNNWQQRFIADVLDRQAGRRGSLLPILHEVQGTLGHIPPESVAQIAQALNLSRAEVHGTVSFYHDFRTERATRPLIKLCRAEACRARGVENLAPIFEGDARITVETVYCLGLCASGPSAMVGDEVHARLNEAKARQLIERAALA